VTRVLVTGASGFIGKHLCRRLVREGHEVHGVSRNPRQEGDVRWRQADLADATATRELLEQVRPDTVFHLASYVSGSRDLDAVLPTMQHNLVAAVNVLVAAAGSGCGLVALTGSMEEPESPSGEPTPASPYAAAKYASGAYGRMIHALHDLAVVNLRVFMVYGPGQDDRTKLVPYVVTSLLRGERPRLSSGVRPVDWVYVDDVVDAFLAAARTPDLAGATLDVGSGELVTIRSIVEQIVETVGTAVEPDFGALPDRPLEQVRTADVERTRSMIGWEPRTTLAAGLRTTVEWYLRERDESAAAGSQGTRA
jgi:UDP-glucose 4-epimerase